MNDILGTPFGGPHSYNLGGKSVQELIKNLHSSKNPGHRGYWQNFRRKKKQKK